MKELIAHCGLDCEKCDARVATVNNDDGLREKDGQTLERDEPCAHHKRDAQLPGLPHRRRENTFLRQSVRNSEMCG